MSDPRFARLKSDPRFRRPKRQENKIVVDDRFKDVFASKKQGRKNKSAGRVDKYGRLISDTHEQDSLKRFYRLKNEDDDVTAGNFEAPDYARGEVLLQSSDEDDDEQAAEDDDSNPGDFITVGRDASRPIAVTAEDEEAEIDLDESNFADLDAQASTYNETHPETSQEGGDRTHRLAAVNLDWDHVRASHLYKICSSLVSPTAPLRSSPAATPHPDRQRAIKGTSSTVARGKIVSVRVYPSEFGKERLAREEKEGPPAEIFKRRKELDEEEVNAQNIYEVGGEDDYNEDALRKYQLERLRYYYAIITCDTVDAAAHVYTELEGTELERSANVFDLSFIPDDMNFDDEFRDEASEEHNVASKGVDFVTDALRHSKVKLTWDDDDPERNQVTRRTLSRKEIEEADFKAYLASSSSESEDEVDQLHSGSKKDTKATSRDQLRALLLSGGDNDLPEGWGGDRDVGDVDMEITFTPGLSENASKDETTLGKYQRKMREKRKKRKEGVKEKDAQQGDDTSGFFDIGSGDEHATETLSNKAQKSVGHQKKLDTDILDPPSERPVTTMDELSLLVTSDNLDTEPRHFNLKSVLKAEKKSKRKGKQGKRREEEGDNEVQEDFAIDVQDDRFKALHEDHQFAIDPSNPQFKKTKGMISLLQERTKRQKVHRGDSVGLLAKRPEGHGERSLKSLVESVKRKSATAEFPGAGKRRRVDDSGQQG